MSDKTALRPFQVEFPEAEVTELRRRIKATRLPEKEPVADKSQGVPLATIEKLARYWGTEHDWRRCEAKINAVPNFITEIDGLDIHFIHARSKHENALPIIVTHGWPGSVVEQLKIIEPLTNPTAHGGTASDAFHVVIPDMPGYGFSGKPTTTGWGPDRIARAWAVLMNRLGYTRYVAQGGDWGAVVTDLMAVQAPPGLIGMHTNFAGTVPPEIDKLIWAGSPLPSGLSADEKLACDMLAFTYKNIQYALYMASRPQTLYAIADSPVGLAAWLLDHDPRSLDMIARSFDGVPEGLTPDDVLDNCTLLLVDEYGRLRFSALPGEHVQLLIPQGRQHPGGRERLPGRALPSAAELGGEGVSQADPLQQAPQGRPFRGLGTAEALHGGTARGLQITAQITEQRSANRQLVQSKPANIVCGLLFLGPRCPDCLHKLRIAGPWVPAVARNVRLTKRRNRRQVRGRMPHNSEGKRLRLHVVRKEVNGKQCTTRSSRSIFHRELRGLFTSQSEAN